MQKQGTTRREFVVGKLGLLTGALVPLGPGFAAEGSGDWADPKVDAGVDRSAIQGALDDAQSVSALRSILVVKNGSPVGERYYGGAMATDLQSVNSVTKSIASILVGIAIQQGRIRGVSETVASLLPEAAEKAPGAAALSITLEQILNQTSGLAYDYRTGMPALEAAQDPVAYVLGLPVDSELVGRWVYNDAAVSLLSPILARAQGMPVDQFAQRDLFRPLGIDRVVATRDKAGAFRSYAGLRLRPRDLAKVAWTIANDGLWEGRQIVPKDWIKTSTSFHVQSTWGAPPMQKAGYGYLWFRGNLNGRDVVLAWGYGAQFAVVVPSHRLVVTTTAINPRPRDLSAQNSAVMAIVAKIVDISA